MDHQDLHMRERELKKRWAYPYHWGRVQNDLFDAQIRFVFIQGRETLSDVIWAIRC